MGHLRLLPTPVLCFCYWTILIFSCFEVSVINAQSICQNLIKSPNLEKFVDPLPLPSSIDLTKASPLTMGAYKISQKLHRDLPNTTLYAFGTSQASATYPGPTLIAKHEKQESIFWENHITDESHLLTVDTTLNWASPKNGGVPLVVHLHGGEVEPTSDGHPSAWFTAKGEKGPAWYTQNYTYPNSQFPTMLWYHDHTIGITRLNVYAGLLGLYFVTDSAEKKSNLPAGQYHIPLIIQDKQFYANGSLNYPNTGTNSLHPNWCPEFFGDTILVNGKVWPYLNVEARRYRFRVLNGANARFFNLSFNSSALWFMKVGTDGGVLSEIVNQTHITLGPAERVDVVVNFAVIASGTDVVLQNSAPYPFPGGQFPSGGDAVVMKFHVTPATGAVYEGPIYLPKQFSPDANQPLPSVLTRNHTLEEITDASGNVARTSINNLLMMDPATEKPVQGTTETWQIINLTPDAHPIHLHLVRFRMKNQQAFNADGYKSNSCSIAVNYPDPKSCYTANFTEPYSDQSGWKDTITVWPGYVTRFLISFTAQDEKAFPFNITQAPGYVWHCHIIDHEDNEMMRPLVVQPPIY